jgi:uncharacterized protein (TIGR02145 family)
MKKSIYLYIYLSICLSVSLNGQSTNSQEVGKGESIQRNATYNLEEIKVRWKKAALENCPGVPCVPPAIPGAPTSVVATAGNTSASVAFTAPSNNGGSVITGYTVTSNPGGITGTGSGSPITVSGLTNGTSYTFTVVAINAVGSSAASAASTAVTSAVCPTSTVTDVDGNIYNTVAIGTQCWTKENLKVTKYNDGTTIILDATQTSPTDGTSLTWQNRLAGAYTIYGNESSTGANVTNYGFLYNWYAAKGIFRTGVIASTDTLNLCPTGWHVPTDSDWNKLIISIDSGADTTGTATQSTTAGDKMKSTSTLWNSISIGTDDYGFAALPGGYRLDSGIFGNKELFAFFWSADENDININEARNRSLYFFSSGVHRTNYNKSYGGSIRCLRD